MPCTDTIIVGYFISIWTFIASMESTSKYFDVESSTNLASNFITVKSWSAIECGCLCSSDVCSAASFDKLKKECRIDINPSMDIQSVYEEHANLMRKQGIWHFFNGRYYYVGLTPKNWNNAKDDCAKKGSHLVKIDDMTEQQWLKSLLQLHDGVVNTFIQTWTGGNDYENEGQFVWVSDGTPLMSGPGLWQNNQPDNWAGNEHCVTIVANEDFKWNDNNCNKNFPYICEK